MMKRQSQKRETLPPNSSSPGDGKNSNEVDNLNFDVTNAEINQVDSRDVEGHYGSVNGGNRNKEDDEFFEKLTKSMNGLVDDGLAGFDTL